MYKVLLALASCLLFLPSYFYGQTLVSQQANPVLGGRSILVIRGVDPATHTWDVAAADLTTLETEMDAYVRAISFNKAWISTFDVTPVYNFTVGTNTSYTYMANEVQNQAIAGGYNLNDYNVIIYTYRSTTDLGGAGALGSGDGLSGSVYYPGQLLYFYKGVIHETLHAFGLGHAENIEGGDKMYPGGSTGGHDPYHFMGSEQGNEFDIPVYMKYALGWIDPSEIYLKSPDLPNCETLRLYEGALIDSYDNTRKYALQLGDNLWLSYVPNSDSPNIVDYGVLLHYIPSNQTGLNVSRILDTSPNSITNLGTETNSAYQPVMDFWDAAMEVGDVAYWEGATITVIEKGGIGDDEWIDVEICNCIQETADSDNDGICDTYDICEGFDDALDADFDFLPDNCDTCPNDPNNDGNDDGICDDIQCFNQVSESFEYATTTDINTANGGLGLSGAWTQNFGVANSNISIEAGSLPTSEIATSGNKLLIDVTDEVETAQITRTLSLGFSTGQTMWLSALLKANDLKDGGFWIKPDSRQDIAIGKRWGAELAIDNNGTGINMVAGETYWIVAKYALEPTQTVVHLWANPTPQDLLDVATADATKTVGSVGVIDKIDISVERWGMGAYEIDELKMTCQAPERIAHTCGGSCLSITISIEQN